MERFENGMIHDIRSDGRASGAGGANTPHINPGC
jgi:hypothetical protein